MGPNKYNFHGYSVKLSQLSQEDGGGWLASIPELPSCLADGETPDEAYGELKEVLDFYLEVAKEDGIKLKKPEIHKEITYSGRIGLRLPKNLHRILSEQAEREGCSLNQYMVSLLSYNAGMYEQSAGIEKTNNYHIYLEQNRTTRKPSKSAVSQSNPLGERLDVRQIFQEINQGK